MNIIQDKKERLAELERKKDPFNWDFINQNLEVIEDEIGDKFLGHYLGEILHLNPSGKFYTFWTTNQTERDVRRDTAYWERLERYAERQGFGITYLDNSAYLFKMDWEPEKEEENEEDEGE